MKKHDIYIVGMGPGAEEMMTGQAFRILQDADVIVGYTVYLELLGPTFANKKMLSTPMKQEEKRCVICFEEAMKGQKVAMICSGDAGVYGMASLMYEIGREYPECALHVVPGITAACSGAADLGAPINHDFCVISLSDLLTPWEKIESRLRKAAQADFAMALYNPSSKKRADYLAQACDILLEYIEPERPCGFVENIGRSGNRVVTCTLSQLRNMQVNMFTTVFIGNSTSEIMDGHLVTKRGYKVEIREKTGDVAQIVLFGGTTEGRKMSQWMSKQQIPHIVCVATEYGEQVLQESPFAQVHIGRMDQPKMEFFFQEKGVRLVIDATHPYARVVTENLVAVTKKMKTASDIEYIRLEREGETVSNGVLTYADTESCLKALAETQGNILLTTGSKDLHTYCEDPVLKERLYVRVLPGSESIGICETCGVSGSHIIAMQGPFSKEMNLALIHQFDIRVLVTKQSGKNGGFAEKVEAAKETGIDCFVITPPESVSGSRFESVCKTIRKVVGCAEIGTMYAGTNATCEKDETISPQTEINLIGCGMNDQTGMTCEAVKALEQADVVFGAQRLLHNMKIMKKQFSYYLAADIVPEIEKGNYKSVAILFSGDTGFYSGAKKMMEALKQLGACVNIFPGISSVSYLAAKSGINWDDAQIVSVHGRGEAFEWGPRLTKAVRNHEKTFVLLSGVEDLHEIAQLLLKESNASEIQVVIGYRLGYPEEEIHRLTLEECLVRTQEGLYSLYILNNTVGGTIDTNTGKCPTASVEESTNSGERRRLTPGMDDSEFIRGAVPMTKEEIRTISISKLGLWDGATVYDVGCGTGSVAVEIARLSPAIEVYGIERNPEAVSLIRQNATHFGLENIHIVESEAPSGLEDLPAATHAFIGGSGGRLHEILASLEKKNPRMRIVINAVSMETLQELTDIGKIFAIKDYRLVNLSATRTKELGNYHMLQGENPVWICSFQFAGE